MGYNYNYDELRNMETAAINDLSSLAGLIQNVTESLQELTLDESFRGAWADAIKEHIRHVHLLTGASIVTIMNEYVMRFALFAEELYSCDSDNHAVLNEEALTEVSDRLQTAAVDLGDVRSCIRTQWMQIEDQVPSTLKSGETYMDPLEQESGSIKALRDKLGDYDHTCNTDLSDLKDMISTALSIVTSLEEKGVMPIEAGTPFDQIDEGKLEKLYDMVVASQEYITEHAGQYEAAMEHLSEIFDEIKEEIRQQRIKQGVFLVITSVVAVAGIVFSMGTLAPALIASESALVTAAGVTVVATGTAAAAYNTSNLIQGYNEIRLGVSGDISTTAWNPMRDTIFQGDQTAYDAFGMIATTAYTVSVPLGGFAAASQCSEVLTTRVAAEFWVFADTAAGYATDQAVAVFCEQIEADEMTTFLLGTGAGLLAGMAMDRLRPGFVSTMENIDYEYEESFQRVMGEMKEGFEHFLHDNRGFLNLEAFGRRSKTIDELINGLKETTNGKGIARNFETSGGYEQTLKDFEALNPINVKDIQTKYGPGKVGTLSNGTKIVARQGSATGGATLEIKVSNNKVYKIRY